MGIKEKIKVIKEFIQQTNDVKETLENFMTDASRYLKELSPDNPDYSQEKDKAIKCIDKAKKILASCNKCTSIPRMLLMSKSTKQSVTEDIKYGVILQSLIEGQNYDSDSPFANNQPTDTQTRLIPQTINEKINKVYTQINLQDNNLESLASLGIHRGLNRTNVISSTGHLEQTSRQTINYNNSENSYNPSTNITAVVPIDDLSISSVYQENMLDDYDNFDSLQNALRNREKIVPVDTSFDTSFDTSIDSALDLRLVGIDGYDTYQARTNSPKPHP